MEGLVGPAIVEERGGGGFSSTTGPGVGVYSGGGTSDAFVVVPLRGSPTSTRRRVPLASRSHRTSRGCSRCIVADYGSPLDGIQR